MTDQLHAEAQADATRSESANSPPPSEPESLVIRLTKAITPVLGFGGAAGVLLISLGWSYAWHWFAAWNVPFANLGLTPEILLEYGRLVVWHFWWQACVALAILVLAVSDAHRKRGCDKALPAVMLLVFLLPWLFSHKLADLAVTSALAQQRDQHYASWPEVQLILQPDQADALPSDLVTSLGTGPDLCHRLLFKAPDGLWLIRMNAIGRPGATVFVPSEAILYLRLRAPSGGDC